MVSSAPRPPRALTAPHPAGSRDARRGDERYAGRVRTAAYELERACLEADLATGTVLVPGVRAPRLVSNELAGRMRPGSVLVDISTDQGACSADSRPATHADPTYTVHGSVF
ncbi:hypothetical protein BJF90_13710 [Pseudonocardia sp. CNS-004]|nr:hypothetical protein BJF90_13710 [Pseudonocardia sp. CNS-004]